MDVKIELKKRADELDGPIRSYIGDESPSNLIEATRQYPYAGGKRMRPCMVVSACRAVGGDGEKAVPLAVAIEYIHNFTLIHDDLMDGDVKRRGMDTSHVVYGMPTAILAGDALFARAFEIIAALDIPSDDMRRVLKSTGTAVWDLARGQQMDINNENSGTVSMEDYIETIRLKTSVLFAAGVAGGAIIGGADERTVEAMHGYAMNMGVAFQMFDDILGIYGDPKKTGKSAGNDIRKGKNTVMVCRFRDTVGEGALMDEFMAVFGKEDAADSEIETARRILKETGCYAYAMDMAEEYTNKAIACLDVLPDSQEKEFMKALAEYAMDRDV